MRVLVTGSEGFIGKHLCNELQRNHHTISRFDSKFGDDAASRDQLENIIFQMNPDRVVHLAAKVGRLFGEDDVKATIMDNAAMTANVAQVCGEHHIPLTYASTSEVYGDNGMVTAYEDRGQYSLPHNMYGLSKRWGEEACRLYAPKGLTIWRISMPYGPGLPAGRGRAAMINFLYNALHGLPITVHRASERSWCWIGDTVKAMVLTLEEDVSGVWNIGRDDNPTSMAKVAKMALALTESFSPIELVDPPAMQTVVKRLSTWKIRDLGWEPKVELHEGMQRTLEYVKTLPAPVRVVA